MLTLDAPWWTFILRGAVVYLAVLVGVRLFGRRELGQMTPFDLVMILLIANGVQNAMIGSDTSLTGGLVVAATLFAVNRSVAMLSGRLPWLDSLTEGHPAGAPSIQLSPSQL